MKSFVPFAVAVAALAVAAPRSAAQVNDPRRLYGRVVTMDGEEFEGFIRWGGKDGRDLNGAPAPVWMVDGIPAVAKGRDDGLALVGTPSTSGGSGR